MTLREILEVKGKMQLGHKRRVILDGAPCSVTRVPLGDGHGRADRGGVRRREARAGAAASPARLPPPGLTVDYFVPHGGVAAFVPLNRALSGRAAEHAPRDPLSVLECVRGCLAEIVECAAGPMV